MKKISKILVTLLFCVGVGVLVTSCNKSAKDGIEYVPFQETKDGRWGMISPDGKVLFKEEFEEEPTVVKDGRFFVKTKEGYWRMYEASKKPKQIGSEYVAVSHFYNGKAIVTEKNKPVSIIDTKGKVVKLLDKIEGKTVLGVVSPSDGFSVFNTSDSLKGAINNSGKCIIKPQYCFLYYIGDNKFLAVDKKYKKELYEKEKGKWKYQVLSSSGKVIFEFARDKFEDVGSIYEGKMPVSIKVNGKESWGIIDDKGEYVVKPSEKYEKILGIRGDKFIYKNEDKWGLANMKGETLIRAKYDGLTYGGDNILRAKVEDDKYKFIDEEDNQIGNETYLRCYSFDDFDGKHTFVVVSDSEWSIIDKTGKELKGLPDMVSIGVLMHPSYYIESDFVDISKVISSLNITNQGALGVNFNMTAQQIVVALEKAGIVYSSDPENYTRSTITLTNTVEGVEYVFGIDFPESTAKRTYRTESNGWWSYQVPTGYAWNNVKPKTFTISFENFGKLKGKIRSMYDALTNKFKTMGTVVKKGDNAITFNLKDGNAAVVYIESSGDTDQRVSVMFGKFKAENINVDNFDSSGDLNYETEEAVETVTEEY